MYSIFFRRWQREHRRLLPLRAEEYYARPKVLYLPTYLPTFTTHAMITLPNLVVPHTLYSLSIRPYYTMLSILCALYRPCSRAPCVSSAWGHRQTMRAGRPFSLLRPRSLAAVQREGRRRWPRRRASCSEASTPRGCGSSSGSCATSRMLRSGERGAKSERTRVRALGCMCESACLTSQERGGADCGAGRLPYSY